MSRPALLQLFRRVGVTELEARSGTLPPASQRWRRIRQALGVQPASAFASVPTPTPTPTPSQEPWHAFADSLERDLDAASPMQEAGQSLAGSSRKRPRSDDALDRSPQQPAQARSAEQSDALHAHLSGSRGLKRPRTKPGGGLPDPGTPTGADLAASSTVFVGQDAANSAGADDDFRAFDEDGITWLMDLFA